MIIQRIEKKNKEKIETFIYHNNYMSYSYIISRYMYIRIYLIYMYICEYDIIFIIIIL